MRYKKQRVVTLKNRLESLRIAEAFDPETSWVTWAKGEHPAELRAQELSGLVDLPRLAGGPC